MSQEDSTPNHLGVKSIPPESGAAESLPKIMMAMDRITHYGDLSRIEDLERDISFLRDSLSLYPPETTIRSGILNSLGNALNTRYSQLGHMEDLEDCISFHRDALRLRRPGHPDRSISLSNLAVALINRYEQSGNAEDLEDCITLERDALSLRLPGHPDRAMSLGNLAIALMMRYEQSGNAGDLEDCILFQRDALSLRPPGDPDRSIPLSNLAIALKMRYEQSGNAEELEECITFERDALSLRPPGHPDRSMSLGNLSIALMTRYERSGSMEDLKDSIALQSDALSLRPPGHPHRSMSLGNLAIALMTRYEQSGNAEDLQDCITFERDALSLRPPGHPDRSISLSNLAIALKILYEQSGNSKDLEDSISFQRDALGLRPPGHPHRSISLGSLATALMMRYEQLGNTEDLEDCIVFHRDSLTLRPPGHPSRFASLGDLAKALRIRYGESGSMEDLEDSIALQRDSLSLHPPGHPHRSASLGNLAAALMTRFEQLGNAEDLQGCITFERDALRFRPPGHPDRSISLGNLANALLRRYEHFGDMEDLEDSISLQRYALSLRPPGHPHHSVTLGNLAIALEIHYERSGNAEDLEECITFEHDALNLRPPGHPDRSISLGNLANALRIRYEQSGNMEDLEDSVLFQRDALSLRPPGHPNRSITLYRLAIALRTRYECFCNEQDFQETFHLLAQVASDFTSHLRDRLRVIILWIDFARSFRHKSIFSAYTTFLQLVNRSLIFRSTVESQQRFLASANVPKSLASDAASAALQAGKTELAVEFLEQGRALLWSKVDMYKYPLELLRQVKGGDELADRLHTLGTKLEHLVLSSRSTILDEKASARAAALDKEMKQHRVLSEEWNDVVEKIRKIDGFSDFLQAAPFHTLQLAAAEGPVILVNISKFRSDAIILRIDDSPILVTLPTVRLDELENQTMKRNSKREIVGVLRYLWDNIVSPVVDRLAELEIPKKSRIWWCPTGQLCALPLHAAGPYRPGERNLPDLYTCSYTSTLSSLIRARSNTIQPEPTIPKLLVVGQPSNKVKLKKVKDEVDAITALRPDDSVDVLFGAEANCEAALDGLKHHPWVHFACHGHLGEDNQPFQASFELHDDRRLPLLDLIRARLPNAELAFLSACHSAEGDSRTPDESIHLSAALQFCGFRSVVGTLWEMDDEDGPMISKEFYKYMFRNPDKIDFRDSAHALSKALKEMKRAKVPLDRLVLFVHIGA